jgi:hypothetical protein
MITSPEEFIRLRLSEDPALYQRAATDEAPVSVWMELVAHHPDMRSWVAHNKSVPIEVLQILSKDADPDVRCVVAGKRKLTRELFEILAVDPDEGVRQRVAYNKSAPADILERLSADMIPLVADAARKQLGRS